MLAVCPNCNTKFRVPEKNIGKKLLALRERCPKCWEQITIFLNADGEVRPKPGGPEELRHEGAYRALRNRIDREEEGKERKREEKVRKREKQKQKDKEERKQRSQEREKQRVREATAAKQKVLWKTMTGLDFEEFLGDLFNNLGYEVDITQASQDQGVDLVVTDPMGVHTAIQAKGGETVIGNQAVQEVHTGKLFYNCAACCVITNSTFTRQACELAETVQCKLIDKGGLAKLITEADDSTRRV